MQLNIDPDELRPLVESVVAELLEWFGLNGNGDRLAFSEAEAAALLGTKAHVLRDERLRGRVQASVVGKGIRYTRRDLIDYLDRRRWGGGE